MKLSDVMSAMGLAGYAEVALILFLVAFAIVAFDVIRKGRALESHASMPLSIADAKPEPVEPQQ